MTRSRRRKYGLEELVSKITKANRHGETVWAPVGAMKRTAFDLKVEFSRELDGRWIADIAALPGVTVYGRSKRQALTAVEVLALRVIADCLEHGELKPGEMTVSFAG
jgi:predicted RNase H-like HicB family nuclease